MSRTPPAADLRQPPPIPGGSAPDVLPERVVADLGQRDGPLLLVTCLVHGNEPAGELACERVLHRLGLAGAPPLAGRMVVVRGNLRASAAGVRRIDHDLNRVFPPGPAAQPPPAGERPPHEHAERDALAALIARLVDEHPGAPLWFLDLHTTSSESLPYLSLPAEDPGLATFASGFPLHRVSGFSRIVPGTLDRYLHELGFVGFCCEGGQHERHSSISNMEAVLWLMLEQTGVLGRAAEAPMHEVVLEAHAVLEKFVLHRPAHFRLVHRHGVDPDDGFRMEPGFANFAEVRAGQILAHDRRGPVLCPRDGHILMPLYQPSGADGFFLVEEVETER